jgi:hypothetical protein
MAAIIKQLSPRIFFGEAANNATVSKNIFMRASAASVAKTTSSLSKTTSSIPDTSDVRQEQDVMTMKKSQLIELFKLKYPDDSTYKVMTVATLRANLRPADTPTNNNAPTNTDTGLDVDGSWSKISARAARSR